MHIREPQGERSDIVASNLDDLLLIWLTSDGKGVASVHLQGFAERRAKAFEQFGARPALTVDARDLDDPPNPEWVVALNDCCEFLAHTIIIAHRIREDIPFKLGRRLALV